AVGAAVAVVGGVVGVFTVMRGQSFAGHAIADLGATGGAAAFLVGVGPLWGFLAIGIAAAGTMELIGIQRPRGRDLATGIVLGAGLGLAALFLYLDATYHSTSGATVTILFGSVFAISPSTIPIVIVLGLLAVGLGATWLGVVLAYDSYDWPPAGHGWPVSFFVVVAVFVSYLLAGLPGRFRRARRASVA